MLSLVLAQWKLRRENGWLMDMDGRNFSGERRVSGWGVGEGTGKIGERDWAGKN